MGAESCSLPSPGPGFLGHLPASTWVKQETAAPDRQGERRNNLHKGQLHAAPDLLTRHNFNCGHRWLSGKEPACQCRRRRFDPWVRKIPWRRRWQSTPVFLPGKSHGQRSLVGYGPQGYKASDITEALSMHAHTHPCHLSSSSIPYISYKLIAVLMT